MAEQSTFSLESIDTDAATLVGLVIALCGLSVLQALGSAVLPGGEFRQLVVNDLGVKWFVTGLLVALVLYWEGRGLDSIGLGGLGWRDVAAAVLVFVLGAASYVVTTPLLAALGFETTVSGIETLARLPVALLIALSLTAAVTEEVLYRGYPIERLAELTGSVWVGAGLTFLVFTAVHLPFWGVGGTLQIGVNALLLTLLYVWRRNLGACILAHAINDLYAFVIIPRFLMQYVG
ncbi:CPBP family intramembrane glutamic endopeptidase [Halorarum halobium]|uniref:CPBP family intramembrane glutamic endopeptidase n=1 Tax=Halorarum halobium TaxID=3075121 RepID=UPI0028AE99CE|nr:CPBP family intramembrane glutamic endopeptidase [Halobaculum sp. XH14]